MDVLSLSSSHISLNSSGQRKVNRRKSTTTSHLATNDDIKEREMRRKSRALSSSQTKIPAATVPYEQLKEIYATCTKLSAENKINKQNAFGLHLIDYMQEVLQQIKNDQGSNFQVAGCTLDASVKIYGHRVDSVHLDTFRIAGTLGHTTEQPDQATDEPVQDVPEVKKPKRAERPAQSKIETNLKSLLLEKLEKSEEYNLWNSVFARRPISDSFGHGGVDAYILNNFNVACDSGRIIIDQFDQGLNDSYLSSEKTVTLPSFLLDHIYSGRVLGDLENFTFNDWCAPDKRLSLSRNIIPIILKANTDNLSDGNMCDMSFEAMDNNDDNLNLHRPILPEILENDEFSNQEALLTDEKPIPFTLPSKPTEYSYFNEAASILETSKIYQTLNFLSKCRRTKGLFKERKNSVSSQRSQETFDFSKELGADKQKLAIKNGRIKAINSTVQKNENYHIITSPVNLVDVSYLFSLFINKKTFLGDHSTHSPDALINEAPGLIDNDGGNISENNFSNQLADISEHFADDLIQAPPNVECLYIKYAKTAKKVDTKVVKSSMWNLLDSNKNEDCKHQPSSFVEIHKKLKTSLPSSTSKNLSPQLSFVCLLHLANEKHFELSNNETFDSISIRIN